MVCVDNTTSCLSPSTGSAHQIFSSALQFFAATQCLVIKDPLPDSKICDCEEFDIIIVGAGTAGCVVANRLSEIKKWRILMIEAGDDAPIESDIPALSQNMYGSKFDWKYLTTDDGRINQANQNGSIIWPRGKMVGGSSNLNAMYYIKGTIHDYNEWYKAGNVDWHPNVVESYFKKAESYQNQELLRNDNVSAGYGHTGPLIINRFNSTIRETSDKILNSWNELGITTVPDVNSAKGFRSGIFAVTAANGLRQSHDLAYIKPIRSRSNIKFIKKAFVTQILINKFNKAYGVEVTYKRKKNRFYARLEVIISAGTINSPQLLMLSGIGPKIHLESKNINCKVNLAMVGKNLQDHCTIPVTIYGDGPNGPNELTQSFGAIQYLTNRTGYLAEDKYTDIVAFYSSAINFTYPEYENHVGFFWKNNAAAILNVYSDLYRYKKPIANSMAELNKNHTLYVFDFNLLHPMSRGNISLRTNNPNDYPLIYPNYFLDPKDLDSAIVGIKMLTKIVRTKYFKSINGFLGRMSWPACDDLELDSYEYWKCVCINMVLTVYHPVGTCKMGPDPKTSVVDSHLRVHGVKNLRVIDASIMPTITSGNTNGPTGMIGERGADLVKLDHKEL